MASETKTLGLIMVVGAAALVGYTLYTRKQQPNFNNTPQAPNTNPQTPQFAQWATLIISTFGNIAALWQPGGPLYQFQNQYNDVIDAVQDTNPNVNTNPYDFTADGEWGWA